MIASVLHRRRPAAVLACACALVAPAQAQPAAPILPNVVVTATRTPQPAATLLSDLRVIDAATIDRAGLQTLPELLRAHGGVEISSNGGAGQVSGVFLRGSNANHVVVLVDGVRVQSATTGTNAFEHIPLALVERIEILRGPASSLYGADAIGGVIHIFTRDGAAPRTSARVGAGSFGTREASAALARRVGDATTLSLQVGASHSDGFSATNQDNAFAFDPDADGYRNRHLGFSASHGWAPGHRLALRGLHSDGRAQFDAGPGSDDFNRQRLSSLSLESRDQLGEQWVSLLRIARGSDHLNIGGSFAGAIDTDQDQLSWQHEVAAFGGQAVAGAEWRRERVGGDTAYTRTERRIGSLFGGWSGALDAAARHRLQASLRHDDNSQFGGRSTGNVAYGWQATPAWRLSAGLGTAFKAPSFNDLYFPLSFGFSGNPDLRPERSRSAELAARYERDGVAGGLTLFDNRIRDLIAVDPGFTTVINVDPARIRGATLDARIVHGAWSARAEATWQDPRDVAADTLLVRRARRHGSAALEHAAGGWRSGIEWVGVGARFDSAANTPDSRMGGYGLLAVHVRRQLSPVWSLGARIDNLADKDHALVRGYNTPGRALFVSLEYAEPGPR